MPETSPALVHDGATACALRIRVNALMHGMHLNRQVFESDRLTAIRQDTVEDDLHATIMGRPRLTRENPLLPPSSLEDLDKDGLIRPGTAIGDQSVLASVLRLLERPTGQAPPARGMVRVEDMSLRPPPGWTGAAVTEASYRTRRQIGRDASTNLIGRISIQLRLVLRVSIGDVLLLNGRPFTIAGVRDMADCDIVVDASIGMELGLADGQSAVFSVAVAQQAARWAIEARGTGPYSLITQQPLGSSFGVPAQRIEPAHVHTLRASGMAANLAELLTLKSDDIGGRSQLQAALRGQGEFPQPGMPASFQGLLAELTALGLASSLSVTGDHIELLLTPMTDADRLACSSGPITKPETINYRTLKPEPRGLMCEKVFGAEDHPDRRTRFGHLALTDPIVPWHFRQPAPDGGPSILSRILKLDDGKIAELLEQRLRLDEHGEIVAVGSLQQGVLTGSPAIEQLLSCVPDEALPAPLRSRHGARSALVARTILLLPPDLRPLVLLESGNFATSDLNDLYRRIINRNNRLSKLKDLSAPEPILRAELLALQREADHLFANTQLPPAEQVCGDDGEPFKDLMELALHQIQRQRAKRTDYSARARAVPASDVCFPVATLPSVIAQKLELSAGGVVLVTRNHIPGELSTPIVTLQVAVHDHPVIALHPEIFEAMFPGLEAVPECIIHRPLTPMAVAEAQDRLGDMRVAPAPPPASWLDQTDPRSLLSNILDSALTGTKLAFDSPAGVLLAGPGTATFSPAPPPDALPPTLLRKLGPGSRPTMDIPIPVDIPAAHGPDLLARMRDVAMDHRRKALVFRWAQLDRPPRPEDGTIGYGPWLPPGFDWPHVRGRPIDLVAQRPLDPARATGVLPPGVLADVPAHALLTLFWDFENWDPVQATSRVLRFIPISSELVRADDSERAPRLFNSPALTFVSEVVEEVPCWSELCDIFGFEFGDIDRKTLLEFQKTVVPTLPMPQPLTKFGGWAAWIQDPASSRPLLFQVASDEETDLMFGDGGVLYATAESQGITLVTQCY